MSGHNEVNFDSTKANNLSQRRAAEPEVFGSRDSEVTLLCLQIEAAKLSQAGSGRSVAKIEPDPILEQTANPEKGTTPNDSRTTASDSKSTATSTTQADAARAAELAPKLTRFGQVFLQTLLTTGIQSTGTDASATPADAKAKPAETNPKPGDANTARGLIKTDARVAIDSATGKLYVSMEDVPQIARMLAQNPGQPLPTSLYANGFQPINTDNQTVPPPPTPGLPGDLNNPGNPAGTMGPGQPWRIDNTANGQGQPANPATPQTTVIDNRTIVQPNYPPNYRPNYQPGYLPYNFIPPMNMHGGHNRGGAGNLLNPTNLLNPANPLGFTNPISPLNLFNQNSLLNNSPYAAWTAANCNTGGGMGNGDFYIDPNNPNTWGNGSYYPPNGGGYYSNNGGYYPNGGGFYPNNGMYNNPAVQGLVIAEDILWATNGNNNMFNPNSGTSTGGSSTGGSSSGETVKPNTNTNGGETTPKPKPRPTPRPTPNPHHNNNNNNNNKPGPGPKVGPFAK